MVQATVTWLQLDTAAPSGSTVSATPGNASAAGLSAGVIRIIGSIAGNASAAGNTAALIQTIGATPGNAAAAGNTAALVQTIGATLGNATAAGNTAAITNGGSVTISATVGNAVADGVSAAIYGTTKVGCVPGDASADGKVASIGSGSAFVMDTHDGATIKRFKKQALEKANAIAKEREEQLADQQDIRKLLTKRIRSVDDSVADLVKPDLFDEDDEEALMLLMI